jgi:hypothetical protein
MTVQKYKTTVVHFIKCRYEAQCLILRGKKYLRCLKKVDASFVPALNALFRQAEIKPEII